MAFDATIIHWRTLAEFTAYIQNVARPAWCSGITHHNTYIPNEFQWRGMQSMQTMIAAYSAKGWDSGPHLFLAARAPNPADTGIWQMTPITHPGTHAGPCNSHVLGVESVGDFDARPPAADQYTLLLAVSRLIMQRWGLPPSSINVHNECMSGRTCPGKYLTGTQIRADLAKPIPRPPALRRYALVSPCTPFTSRAPASPLADGCVFAAGDNVQVGDVTDGWAWVSDAPDTAPGIGFLPMAYLRPLMEISAKQLDWLRELNVDEPWSMAAADPVLVARVTALEQLASAQQMQIAELETALGNIGSVGLSAQDRATIADPAESA